MIDLQSNQIPFNESIHVHSPTCTPTKADSNYGSPEAMRTVEPQIAAHRWLTTNPSVADDQSARIDGNQKVAFCLYIVYSIYSICCFSSSLWMKLPEDIPDATLHKETKLTLHPSPVPRSVTLLPGRPSWGGRSHLFGWNKHEINMNYYMVT